MGGTRPPPIPVGSTPLVFVAGQTERHNPKNQETTFMCSVRTPTVVDSLHTCCVQSANEILCILEIKK